MTETAKIIELENVSEKASALNKEAQDMLTTYKQTQIKTNDQYVKAGDVLKEIKTKIKDLDEERKAATMPLAGSQRFCQMRSTARPMKRMRDLKKQ